MSSHASHAAGSSSYRPQDGGGADTSKRLRADDDAAAAPAGGEPTHGGAPGNNLPLKKRRVGDADDSGSEAGAAGTVASAVRRSRLRWKLNQCAVAADTAASASPHAAVLDPALAAAHAAATVAAVAAAGAPVSFGAGAGAGAGAGGARRSRNLVSSLEEAWRRSLLPQVEPKGVLRGVSFFFCGHQVGSVPRRVMAKFVELHGGTVLSLHSLHANFLVVGSSTHVCVCVCVWLCMSVWLYVWLSVCVSLCVAVCVCVCVCVFVCRARALNDDRAVLLPGLLQPTSSATARC